MKERRDEPLRRGRRFAFVAILLIVAAVGVAEALYSRNDHEDHRTAVDTLSHIGLRQANHYRVAGNNATRTAVYITQIINLAPFPIDIRYDSQHLPLGITVVPSADAAVTIEGRSRKSIELSFRVNACPRSPTATDIAGRPLEFQVSPAGEDRWQPINLMLLGDGTPGDTWIDEIVAAVCSVRLSG